MCQPVRMRGQAMRSWIKLSVFLFLVVFGGVAKAQDYFPGGIGNADLVFWFSADSLVTDLPPISAWEDISGNGRDAIISAAERPDHVTNEINGNDVVRFDGTDRVRMNNDTAINTTSTSYSEKLIMVMIQTGADVTTRQLIYEQGGGNNATGRGLNIYIDNDSIHVGVWATAGLLFTSHGTSIAANSTYLLSFVYDDDVQGFSGYLNGTLFGNSSAPLSSILPNTNGIAIGGITGNTRFDATTTVTGTGDRYMGDLAEIVYYNVSAEAYRVIIENAWALKFNQTISNDLYASSGSELMGIGRTVTGTVDSSWNEGLKVRDNGYLQDNGDYLFAAHNELNGSTQAGNDVYMNRTWNIDLTDVSSNGGNVDLVFDLDHFPESSYLLAANFYLRVNGAETLTGTGSISGNEITFTASATAIDGATITVGNNDITSTQPEVCGDGIDNDGDGLVDCFDDACAADASCSDAYVNVSTPSCAAGSFNDTEFQLNRIYKSDETTAPLQQRSGVYVADMDNDGTPDIVGKNPDSAGVGMIVIFDGADGSLKQGIAQANTSTTFSHVALGDVDGDGLGDIFTVETGNIMQRYEYNTVGPVWTSADNASSTSAPPALADFDQDGVAEVFVEDRIWNAIDGTRLVAGSGNQGRNSNADAQPVAFDIFKVGDALPGGGGNFGPEAAGLEFIAGNEIYTVDLGDGTTDNGRLELAATLVGFSDGFTSIADLNLDGRPDVIVTSGGNVYAWDPYTQTQIGTTFPITGTTVGGRCNLGDFDGDGILEIGVAGNDFYLVIDYDTTGNSFSTLWSKSGLTDGSERTGSTLFDFEGDGNVEVVYKDQDSLYIWQGSDGARLAATASGAGTRAEYPLVADVDGDDQAEIVVASQTETSPGDFAGYVEVYRAADIPWVSARGIWNQHAYFNTNINPDLSIPQEQQDHTDSDLNGLLNGFLAQATITDGSGNPATTAADATVTINNTTINGPDVDLTSCKTGTGEIRMNVTVGNSGIETLPAGTAISYYNGNPFTGAATLLKVRTLTSDLASGGSVTFADTISDQSGNSFDLYIVANHDGTSATTPLTRYVTSTADCDTTNNVFTMSFPGCLSAVDDIAGALEDFGGFTNVGLNDQNPSGAIITASIVSDGMFGTNAIIPTTNVILTPTPDYFGNDTVTYRICMVAQPTICDTAQLVWVIANSNDDPEPENDTIATNEDTPFVGDVSTNDSDPDGDALTYTGPLVGPSNGSVVMDGAGNFTYTPDQDFHGSDAFTYQVQDPGLATGTATVVITVNSVNDGAVAVNDTFNINEDDNLANTVATNDSDVESDALTFDTVLISGPSLGVVDFEADGSFTYDPNQDVSGTETFEYRVCDAGIPSGCDTAVVVINIAAVNDTPVGDPESFIMLEDGSLAGDVSLNDSDVEGHNLSYDTLAGNGPSNGTLVLNANGTFTYDPDLNFNGSDSFIYEVCDDGPGAPCDTSLVTITITAVNDTPVAVVDSFTTTEDVTLNDDVSTNDNDVDGDPLTFNAITTPAWGSIVLATNGALTFTPAADSNGVVSFSYRVCDGTVCDTNNVVITVNSVNDDPVADPDNFVIAEDGSLASDVSTNDSDVEGDNLTYNTTPVSGTTNGTLVLLADGSFTYDPDLNFNGSDSFIYEVCDDGVGTPCDTSLVTITITAVNDTPVAVVDSFTTNEEVTLNDDVSTNDSDVDGDPLTFNAITTPAWGSIVLATNGALTFTPAADSNGVVSFSYRVCDGSLCDTNNVVITVNPVNDDPVADPDNFVMAEDGSLAGDVSTNDSDVEGDNLTYNTTPVSGTTNGTLVLLADGSFTYDPDLNFNGSDSFIYEVCDDGAGTPCDTSLVTITITAVNDTPVAVVDSFTTNEEVTLNDDVSTNDSDVDGDPLTFNAITTPAWGSIVLAANGALTFTPATDSNGVVSFSYRVCDGSLCDTNNVVITVNPVNDDPVADPDNFVIAEDGSLASDVSTNDSDVEGDNLTYNTTPVSGTTNGTLVLLADGSFTYDPDLNFNGSDSFIYEVCDDGVGTPCDTSLVTITVTAVNDTPVAVIDSFTTTEDITLNGDVSTNDSDVDGDALTYNAITTPAWGSIVLATNGALTFTPVADSNGVVSFSYRACDGTVCDTAVVVITVQDTNDAPVADPDNFLMLEDGSLAGDVSTNDSDVEGHNLTYNTTPVSGPANGTLNILADGSFSYDPDLNFNGVDGFIYQVCDDGIPSYCDTSVVTITVDPVNDRPVIGNTAMSVDEDGTLLVDLTVLDSDPDGDALAYDPALVDASNGTLTISTAGLVSYVPDLNYNGLDSFMYKVCDVVGSPLCDSVMITITVNAVADTPVAVNDMVASTAGVAVTVDVQDNDSDGDGDALTTSIVAGGDPLFGAAIVVNGDSITYTPNDPFLSTADTITYQVCDGSGLCDTAQVFVTVPLSEVAPVATIDSSVTAEETPVVIDVLDNDTDVNIGDVLSNAGIISGPSNGIANLLLDQIVYTPADDFFGMDTLTYQVCDQGGFPSCDTGQVIITVINVNDSPVIVDSSGLPDDTINIVTNEGSAYLLRLMAEDADNDALDLTSFIFTGANISISGDNDGDTSITITPDPGYFGTEQLTAVVCDDDAPALCDSVIVNITFQSTNQTPDAQPDAGSTLPLVAVTVDVQDNDSDADGDALITEIVSQGSNGVAVVENNDSITYTPNGGFTTGQDTVTYRVCDPENACDTAIMIVFVDPGEIAPIATDDAATLDEDDSTYVTVLTNDLDGNGDPLSISFILMSASNGDAIITGDSIQYTPNADFFGLDSISYIVCDTTSPTPLCDTGVVRFTVNNVNDDPTTATDILNVSVDENASVDATAIASDIDGDALDLTTTIVAPINGGLTGLGNGDTTVTYTPNADFFGLDSFTVALCDDGSPSLCDTVLVRVTINSTNQAPIAADDFESTDANVAVTIDVQANDIDPDGDAMTTSIVNAPTNGNAVLEANDSITYTPFPGFTSGSDTLSYRVCDAEGACDTAEVIVFVAAGSLAPVATDDVFSIDEDGSDFIIVLFNDSDPNGDPLSISTILDAPVNGVAVITGDSIQYDPTADFYGTDSLTYIVCDTTSPTPLCDTAQVVITINSINDDPVTATEIIAVSVDENASVDITASATDVDGDALDLTGTITTPINGLLSNLNTGDTTVTYTPSADFFGLDSFTVALCDDGTPNLCDTILVRVTINSTNQAPDAQPDAAATLPLVDVTVDVQANDTDLDGDALVTEIVTQGANGIATVGNNDSITYAPNAGFTSGQDTVTYRVCDPENACDTTMLIVFVDPGEIAPIATDDNLILDEDDSAYVAVIANDLDGNGDPLSLAGILQGAVSGDAIQVGDSIQYFPNENFNGLDSVTYLVCDTTSPTPLCDTGRVSITVQNVNDDPVTTTTDFDLELDENATVDVVVVATDVDGDALDLTSLIQSPNNGLVNGLSDGDTTVTYLPNADFFGLDSFTVALCDDGSPVLCDTVTVLLTINSTNQDPIANEDFTTTDPLVAVTIDVQANDVDPDGDVLTTSILVNGANGNAVLEDNDSITYTPNVGFTSGSDTVTYQVCDGEGACDVANVVIFLGSGDLAPIAFDDSLQLDEDGSATVAVLFNDTDPNGDTITISAIISGPANGDATINGDSIQYDAFADFFGTDTLEYVVCDNTSPTALCDTAQVIITVNPVNDAPVIDDGFGTPIDSVEVNIIENDTATIALSAFDVDGDNVDITGVVLTSFNGTINGLFDGDTTIQFIPNLGFDGVEVFEVVVCDNVFPSACDTIVATVNVAALPNNDPIAVNDSVEVLFSVATIIDVQANDSDPDFDVLTTEILQFPLNGVASIVNDDSIQYTASIANGSDTIIYEVCDADEACDTAVVVLTITDGTLPPVAVNDSVTLNEDEVISIKVLTNDSDPNLDELVLTDVSTDPAFGLVVLSGDSLVYTPDQDFNGGDTISYVVCDIGGLCDTAEVVLTINPVQDAPIVVDTAGNPIDSLFLTIGPTDTTFIQVDAIEPDGDGVDVTGIIVTTFNGTIQGLFDGDTAITYEPNGIFLGESVIGLVVCDNQFPSNCDTVGVRLTITDVVNNDPVALDDVVATDSGVAVTVDVQANDFDEDGDLLITSIVSGPSLGSAVVLNNDSIAYTPDPSFTNGRDTVVYQVCDAGGGCDTALLVVLISTDPVAPVAVDDVVDLNEDDFAVVLVLANDVDANGDSLFLSSLTSTPLNGTAFTNGDSLVYLPGPDFNGIDFVNYVVCDITGLCDTGQVVLNVSPVNDAPRILNDTLADADTLFGSLDPGDTLIISPNVIDVDGDGVDLTGFVVNTLNGALFGEGSGDTSITYVADSTFEGIENFQIVVCDDADPSLCDTAVVSLSIPFVEGPGPDNENPIANPDFIAVDSGISVTVNVLANDTDADGDSLILNLIAQPANGVATMVGLDSILYVPNPGFGEGIDTVLYAACDTLGGCDTTHFVIFVPNDPLAPIAVDDQVSTLEEEQLFIHVKLNDTDPNGDPMSLFGIITPPTGGTVIQLGDSIRYTPLEDFAGEDFFDYRVCDDGFLCDTGRVFVTVINVNDAPVITEDTIFVTTRLNFPVDVQVVTTDADENDTIEVVAVVEGPGNGTIFDLATGDTTFQYWPDTSFTGADTMRAVVCDNGDPQLCDSVYVVVTIDSAGNAAPVAEDDIFTSNAGELRTLDVQANDSDPDGDFMVTSIISGPSNGVANVVNDNVIEYTANNDFTQGIDTIIYRVCDAGGLCDTAQALVFLPDSALAPVAATDLVSMNEDDTIQVDVLVNDFDPNGEDITFSGIVTQPANGTASVVDNDINYIPATDFFGTDSISYAICDTNAMCDTGWVVITVVPVNDAPGAEDDTLSFTNSIAEEFNVVLNDTDVDGDVDLELLAVITDVENGTLTESDSGYFTYEPNSGFIGTDEFTYILCDSISCDTATVHITVNAFDGFFISNGVSPNGDGANDFFVIRGLENYPDNEVSIVNRWGNVVFEQTGYNRFDESTVWKGTNASGEPLPDGTYFYVIKLNDPLETMYTGYVILSNSGQ